MAFTTPPSHKSWNELLKANVSTDGKVNYKGFIKEMAKLDAYLKIISENAPERKIWSKDEQFAYWINAFNHLP